MRIFIPRRKIFVAKREAIKVGWRKLHYEELYSFTRYYYGDEIKEVEIGVACSRHERD
jgi:hypothetical protein